MNYLLDTHILLWALLDDKQFSKKARDTILANSDRLYFSSVNVWEVAIKYNKSRNNGFDDFIEPNYFYQLLKTARYKELVVNSQHAIAVKDLPNIHQDPFDRILIAQAMGENLILMTADEKIKQYPNLNLLMV